MILTIGPCRNNNRKQIGGSEILFEHWIEYCYKHHVDIRVIDGNKFNYANKVIALCSIWWKMLWYAPKSQSIFLFGSKNDYLVLAPVAVLIGKILRKPVYLRKFGGAFHEFYADWSKIARAIVRYALKNAEILFWETNYLVEFGKQFNTNCIWIPNTRFKPDMTIPEKRYRKRFVFISHVRKEKGIDTLLEAFRELGSAYQVDIYGSLMGYEESQLEGHYKGVVEPDKIYETLVQYDYLVLPTHWHSEGYPGIIIEAFAVGVPVIATPVGGIPEMIRDRENGRLIPPRQPQILAETIRSITDEDFQREAQNALASFGIYDAEKVNDKILEKITR